MPKPKVWKKVDEINMQKVYHCLNPDCKYKEIEIAISYLHSDQMQLEHCTNCGWELSYSHTEVRS